MDYTIPANVENLSITGGTARSATGNSGNNTLTGNSAASTLAGAAGDDTYVISDATTVVTESSSEGTDLIQASVTDSGIPICEHNTRNGSGHIHATVKDIESALRGHRGAARAHQGSSPAPQVKRAAR